MMNEPLSPADAAALARTIIRSGEIRFLEHFEARVRERGVDPTAAIEAVASGDVVHVEFRKGTYRYRFVAAGLAAVVMFEDEQTIWFVTTYYPEE